MRISTRLLLAALVPIALALIAISGFLVTYTSVGALQRQQSAMIRVRTDLRQLNEFARSYLLHHDERSRRQYTAKTEETIRHLPDPESVDPRYAPEMRTLAQRVRQSRELFAAIVVNYERGGPVYAEAEQRLSAQLFISSVDADARIANTVESISDEIVRRETFLSLTVSGLIILTAFMLTGVLLGLRRGAIKSLAELKAGTDAVGEGDLDYRIEPSANDELGDLGRSFDAMAERLQAVTVSKEDLEREVEQRRRAEEQARRELEVTAVLLEAADVLSKWTDLDSLLTALSDVTLRATRHARVSIGLLAPDRSGIAISATAGRDVIPSGTFLTWESLSPSTRAVLDTDTTALVDYDALPAEERGAAGEFAGRVALLVPLSFAGRVLGHISVDDPGRRTEFSEREIDIVEGIASQAAVAIENARLYQAEHDIADRLQEALLSMPEHIPGVGFDHAYHSATEAARVGGDFYDIFEIDDDRVGIVIGDVAGKGLDAAVLTSLVKNTIRAHSAAEIREPSTVLRLTNDVVYKSTPTESFVTVFFAVLNRRTGRLVYANAGHTTAVIVRCDSTHPLHATGPIVGAFPNTEVAQEIESLDRDGVLFLYTDGLTEARNPQGEQYGEERLLAFLAARGEGTPSGVLGAVLDEVGTFTQGRLGDDMALVAVRRNLE